MLLSTGDGARPRLRRGGVSRIERRDVAVVEGVVAGQGTDPGRLPNVESGRALTAGRRSTELVRLIRRRGLYGHRSYSLRAFQNMSRIAGLWAFGFGLSSRFPVWGSTPGRAAGIRRARSAGLQACPPHL